MTHFTDKEWSNRAMMNQHTVDCLDALREDLGVPINLTADYATAGHSPDSPHYKGIAIDGFCNVSLWDFITKAIKHGFTGIGVYYQMGYLRYFHLDTRETTPTMWFAEVMYNNEIKYMYQLGNK